MRIISRLLIAIVLCALPLVAGKDKPLSDSELAEITARGRFLAEYDNASWHATDAVLALKPVSGSVQKYIAKKTDAGWVVDFGRFNEAGDAFLIVYEATQGASPQQFTVKTYDPPLKDAGYFYLAAKAIALSLQDFRRENRPYNTYVLPLDSGQMYIYIVPAQTVNGVFPLGGDERYLVSADGSKIIEARRLHAAIIEFTNSAPGARQPVSGFHTHVLTDVPEDTDVSVCSAQKASPPGVHRNQKPHVRGRNGRFN